MKKPHRVVIVGGGFGGLYAAKSLGRAAVTVTLLDRRNYHLFQPLLYQVATGALSPANIAAPLRSILKRQRNAEVLLGEVIDFDVVNQAVILKDARMAFDSLVVAVGTQSNYFKHPHWERIAPSLKSIEDAIDIRRRILRAFEIAERTSDPDEIRACLTFVIIGAGPTGVELAGAIAEIARDTMRHDFRRINPADANIILLDAAPEVLPAYPADLRERAAKSLERLGIQIRTGTMVDEICEDSVVCREQDRSETIRSHTILWTAGVKAHPLGAALSRVTGVELDRLGRVVVGNDLTVAGHPNIYVIGDLAFFAHQTGRPLPGVAPVAIQQGKYVADHISARLKNQTMPAFRYRDYGSMATIGRSAAVADFGRVRLSGYPAWLAWLFVHLMYIVEFQNRLLVLTQWTWNYITRNRSARLITEHESRPAQKSNDRLSDTD